MIVVHTSVIMLRDDPHTTFEDMMNEKYNHIDMIMIQ